MNELISRPEALAELGESLKTAFTLVVLCAARLFAMMQVFSPMNDQAVQGPVRNGFCLLIASFVAWGLPLHAVAGLTMLSLTALLLKEILLGVVLGFCASTVFWVAEGVGGLIDNQAGFNNAQQTNPLSGEQSTPVGNLLGQLANCCFWILGGMSVLLGVVFESYHWWPLHRITPDLPALLEVFVSGQVTRYMSMLVVIAAPALLVLLLVDLTFGILAKTADKLEPNSLAQPVKGAVALLMLAVLVALFFEQARPMLALHNMARELGFWLHVGAQGR